MHSVLAFVCWFFTAPQSAAEPEPEREPPHPHLAPEPPLPEEPPPQEPDPCTIVPEFALRPTPARHPAWLLELGYSLQTLAGRTANERILRAYRLGRGAGAFLLGESQTQLYEPFAVRNRVYIVLRSQLVTGAHRHHTFTSYRRHVFIGNQFNPRTCSQAFPSEAEATCFCIGAGLPALVRRI